MASRNNPALNIGLCTALFLNICTVKAASPPAKVAADEAVVLTGWLHVDDLTMTDVVVEVELNGTVQIAPVSANGRFTVTLPQNTEAVLRFEKPGHIAKEVTVDTHHMQAGGPTQRTRKLSFAVILELERRMGGLTYAGPVGNIGFEEGGGCVAVAHDRSLVPARRNAPMVF